jgi:hypothetical protein
MPVVTNYDDFAEAYERKRCTSPKRKPRTPSPTNEIQPGRNPESVSIRERVSLAKVSGVTIGKGRCNEDRNRIIIDGKLLVVKHFGPFKQDARDPNYAPATKHALVLNNEECAYVGTDGKRHVFMRNGKLFGGEGNKNHNRGYYELETIKIEDS